MKKTILTTISVFLALAVSARPAANHYTELNNKSGINLWNAIYTCVQKGYTSLGYDGLYAAYQTTDIDDNGQIIDMYGGCLFSTSNQCGNYNAECQCYNREHSLPKSWWGSGNEKTNQGCDIFHVVPTDGYVNNRRGAYAFGEVDEATYSYNGNKLGSSSIAGYSGTVFEPQDEYKGDFARGYMGVIAKWQLNATSGAGGSIFNNDYTESGNFGLTAYGIELLMKWHRQDPVSPKEKQRNDGIEQTQGNRNPFIDYPELAEYLWGNKRGQTVSLATLVSAYDGYVPDTTQTAPVDTTQLNPTDTTQITPADTTHNEHIIIGGNGNYVKVRGTLANYSGIYLIVYEPNSICLNGAIATLNATDGANTTITIQDSIIASSDEINSYAIIIAPLDAGYSLQTTTGLYIGNSQKKMAYSETPVAYTISNNGAEAIIKNGNYSLQYNTSTNYFRFYTSGQGSIVLYRKAESTMTEAVEEHVNRHQARKIIRNGRIIIIRDETEYDIMGIKN